MMLVLALLLAGTHCIVAAPQNNGMATSIDERSHCIDKTSDCQRYAKEGKCDEPRGSWKTYMSNNCQKSCPNLCRPCADTDPKCQQRALQGNCEDNRPDWKDWMSNNCPLSCNLCRVGIDDTAGYQKDPQNSGPSDGYIHRNTQYNKETSNNPLTPVFNLCMGEYAPFKPESCNTYRFAVITNRNHHMDFMSAKSFCQNHNARIAEATFVARVKNYKDILTLGDNRRGVWNIWMIGPSGTFKNNGLCSSYDQNMEHQWIDCSAKLPFVCQERGCKDIIQTDDYCPSYAARELCYNPDYEQQLVHNCRASCPNYCPDDVESQTTMKTTSSEPPTSVKPTTQGDDFWGTWGSWTYSECGANDKRVRTRTCSKGPGRCLGVASDDTRYCEGKTPDIDAEWSTWNEWSGCMRATEATKCHGFKISDRDCSGNYCRTGADDVRDTKFGPCNDMECLKGGISAVDKKYEEWRMEFCRSKLDPFYTSIKTVCDYGLGLIENESALDDACNAVDGADLEEKELFRDCAFSELKNFNREPEEFVVLFKGKRIMEKVCELKDDAAEQQREQGCKGEEGKNKMKRILQNCRVEQLWLKGFMNNSITRCIYDAVSDTCGIKTGKFFRAIYRLYFKSYVQFGKSYSNALASSCEDVKNERVCEKIKTDGKCERSSDFEYNYFSCRRSCGLCEGRTEPVRCTVVDPCKNGAMCVIKEGGYSCICREGYKGRNCEEYEETNESQSTVSSEPTPSIKPTTEASTESTTTVSPKPTTSEMPTIGVDDFWGTWESWSDSECDGNNQTTRTRVCNKGDPKFCLGKDRDTVYCDGKAPEIDGELAAWMKWSGCMKATRATACNGYKIRMRLCLPTGSYCGTGANDVGEYNFKPCIDAECQNGETSQPIDRCLPGGDGEGCCQNGTFWLPETGGCREPKYSDQCKKEVFSRVEGVINNARNETECQKVLQPFWTASYIVYYYTFGLASVDEYTLDIACEVQEMAKLNNSLIDDTCQFEQPCESDPSPDPVKYKIDEYLVAKAGKQIMDYACSPEAKNLMGSFGSSPCFGNPPMVKAIEEWCNASLLWRQGTNCTDETYITECIIETSARECGLDFSEFVQNIYDILNPAFEKFAKREVCASTSSCGDNEDYEDGTSIGNDYGTPTDYEDVALTDYEDVALTDNGDGALTGNEDDALTDNGDGSITGNGDGALTGNEDGAQGNDNSTPSGNDNDTPTENEDGTTADMEEKGF